MHFKFDISCWYKIKPEQTYFVKHVVQWRDNYISWYNGTWHQCSPERERDKTWLKSSHPRGSSVISASNEMLDTGTITALLTERASNSINECVGRGSVGISSWIPGPIHLIRFLMISFHRTYDTVPFRHLSQKQSHHFSNISFLLYSYI